MRALFLVKLRLSFLWNALDEIILKQHPKRPELRSILPKVSDSVVQCYDELRRTMRSFPRAQEIMSKFRNEASFHYDDAAVSKALRNLAAEKGEAIRNTIVSDMHLVVAYKIGDFIPAGLIEKTEAKDLLSQVDQIQGKLHVFTFKFFIDYIQSLHLEQKICAILRSHTSRLRRSLFFSVIQSGMIGERSTAHRWRRLDPTC